MNILASLTNLLVVLLVLLFLSYSAAVCLGFEANRVYQFQNVQDGNYLHLNESITANVNNIITSPGDGGNAAQMWRVFPEVDGFRITTTAPFSNGLPVIDKNPHHASVYIYTFHGGRNQQWNAHHVGNTPYENSYVILNAQFYCALEMSIFSPGAAVSCQPFDPKQISNSQKWRLF